MLKQHNGLRLWLECLMIAAMLSLMDITTLGSFMHERVGLVLGFLAVGHLLLDWRQLGQLVKRIFRRETPYAVRLGYIVDVLLFAGLMVILVTGIGTSTTIFTTVQLPHRRFFMDLHGYVSNITLLLMAYHLWLHKGWLRGMLRQSFRHLEQPKGRRAAVLWLAALVLVLAGTAVSTAQIERTGLEQRAGYGWRSALSEEDRPIGDAVFTLSELAQYDGKNGRDAYIAYEGVVYDVSAYFIQGEHHQGVHAGEDLTGQITRRKCLNALGHCPIKGVITAEMS